MEIETGGGLLPVAVTSRTQGTYDAFYYYYLGKGFYHGHTYP